MSQLGIVPPLSHSTVAALTISGAQQESKKGYSNFAIYLKTGQVFHLAAGLNLEPVDLVLICGPGMVAVAFLLDHVFDLAIAWEPWTSALVT